MQAKLNIHAVQIRLDWLASPSFPFLSSLSRPVSLILGHLKPADGKRDVCGTAQTNEVTAPLEDNRRDIPPFRPVIYHQNIQLRTEIVASAVSSTLFVNFSNYLRVLFLPFERFRSSGSNKSETPVNISRLSALLLVAGRRRVLDFGSSCRNAILMRGKI